MATLSQPVGTVRPAARGARRARIGGLTGRRIVVRALLWAWLIVFLLPVVWTISSSLKNRTELYQATPSIVTLHPTLANYQFALRRLRNFGLLYRNSIIVTLGAVALQTTLATLAGYGFARINFRGRDLIFYSMLMLIFVPRTVALTAQYEVMNLLGLRNSLFGLVLAFSAGLAVPTFIMRQAFLGIPGEFEDAAKIDGCNRFQAFWHVMTPMVTGAMVVVALFEFIRVWGEYLFTLTMLDDQRKFTLGIGMVQQFAQSTIEIGEFTSYGAQSAAYIMAAAPVILFFLGLQRWFVRGLLSGLKL
jgi:ABC-type glycerol-3-phosphate transport system permease component